jgi:formylglycine-generating enzyme required for sulfatase activity
MPELPIFKIAQFPVTVAEYGSFIDDGGYGAGDKDVPSWWWSAGLAAVEWLKKQRTNGSALRPSTWRDVKFSNPLQPVNRVSWFEALAYCEWAKDHVYSDRLNDINKFASSKGRRYTLRLPTEWEWEAAMRGPYSGENNLIAMAWPGLDVGYRYEVVPTPMFFNHLATGWGRPSPVGCWGASRSPIGMQDGSGNVWNWCANLYNSDWQDRQNGRPTLATIDSVDERRALRGGAFNDMAAQCRIGFRIRNAPVILDYNFGFRLVLSVVE